MVDEDKLEIKCDKFDACKFRNGEVFDICRGRVICGNQYEDIESRYCAFYGQIRLEAGEVSS